MPCLDQRTVEPVGKSFRLSFHLPMYQGRDAARRVMVTQADWIVQCFEATKEATVGWRLFPCKPLEAARDP